MIVLLLQKAEKYGCIGDFKFLFGANDGVTAFLPRSSGRCRGLVAVSREALFKNATLATQPAPVLQARDSTCAQPSPPGLSFDRSARARARPHVSKPPLLSGERAQSRKVPAANRGTETPREIRARGTPFPGGTAA